MRVKVHLAEVPTDVLVFLAGNPRSSMTLAYIAGQVAPPDADVQVLYAVGSALRLLQQGGYVERVAHSHWRVTEAGRTAVREAVQAQAKEIGCHVD